MGEAIQKAILSKLVTREDIFLQTKFTSVDGQDANSIPYDKKAPLEEQVQQSIAKSLLNLQTSYIDSLILHSPMDTFEETLTVWKVFEDYVSSGVVKSIGISNTYSLPYLKKLFESVRIKPSFLQNRFHSRTNYDVEIRKFCLEKGIKYQSFWTLTANPGVVNR